MPEHCVVYGSNNTSSSKKGISLYHIPYWEDNRPVAKGRRKKWLDFIRRKRDKWTPGFGSIICSEHFTEDCFEYGSYTVLKYKVSRLKWDEIGVTALPSVISKASEDETSAHALRFEHGGKVIDKFVRKRFV